jgi:hypothetical protein
MKGVGSEPAISMILAPYFICGRIPLATRLKNIGDIPITFLYGEFDWMD